MNYKCRTIIPYAEALMKFPAHIQQVCLLCVRKERKTFCPSAHEGIDLLYISYVSSLSAQKTHNTHLQKVDMESNGKHTTVDGHEIDYEIGEIDFGEPGTNGQHSFFQLLHMGQVNLTHNWLFDCLRAQAHFFSTVLSYLLQVVPVDFIGFAESQKALHVTGEELSSHDELMCNFFAQPDALAIGKTGAVSGPGLCSLASVMPVHTCQIVLAYVVMIMMTITITGASG